MDKSAIIKNYEKVRNMIGAECNIIAVVKSDAYGLGATAVAKALENNGCHSFAVASFAEARLLRISGITSEILILGYAEPTIAPLLIKYDLTQAIFSRAYAAKIEKALTRMAQNRITSPSCSSGDETQYNISPLKIQIKIDSGMNRLGFRAENLSTENEIKKIAQNPHYEIKGIFSHLSCSDERSPEGISRTEEQGGKFFHLVEKLQSNGVHFENIHIANSLGAVKYPSFRGNAVRCGAVLFGLNCKKKTYSNIQNYNVITKKTNKTLDDNLPKINKNENEKAIISRKNVDDEKDFSKIIDDIFCEVATLKCKVAQVKKVKCGEYIGYGSENRAKKDMKTATVTIGYADGYFRSLSNAGEMIINGQIAKVVGNVCMDMTILDVTGMTVSTGDTVTVWGGEIPLSRLATLAGTIDYELLCRLSPRVKRVYI